MAKAGYVVPSTVIPPNATAALMLTTEAGKSSAGADTLSSVARCSDVRVTSSDARLACSCSIVRAPISVAPIPGRPTTHAKATSAEVTPSPVAT